jgi:hypothetical protein
MVSSPIRPVTPEQTDSPVLAVRLDHLLLMPASRAELYVRNDQVLHSKRLIVSSERRLLNYCTLCEDAGSVDSAE